ncbi:MAG: tetratricopeptide repeat protein [Flavobacteriales bacterium]|nr:tetratricopeptide repeat protein [Flavobacteriales bacterium]
MRHFLTLSLLFLFKFLSASVIPYQGALSSDLEKRFSEIQMVDKTSTRKANSLAHAFYKDASGSDVSVGTWALLNYSYFLLNNDSIAKANQLLLDQSVNWGSLKPWLQAYHHLNLGLVSSYKGDYKGADTQFRIATDLHSDEMGDLLKLKLLIAQAENLRFQGKLDISLNRWYEALTLGESLKDSSEIIACYAGRGVVRYLQREFKRSEQDIQLMFNYHQQIGNKKQLAYAYSLLSLLKYQAEEYETALQYSLKSYEIRKQIGDMKGQGESLNNLAISYMGLKNWNQALTYLEEAIQLKTMANDLTQMTVILNNMGHCHQRLGDPEQAMKYFNLSLEKGNENGQMGDVVTAMRNIMRLYAKQKMFEQAYDMQLKMSHIKDSLTRVEKAETISDLEVRYETEKKEHEIVLLQQEQSITTNRWLTLALGLFLIIIMGFLYADNQKRKHTQERQLLVAEDELKKVELESMSDRLKYNRNKLKQFTENLLRKTELISELEVRVKELADDPNEASEKSRKLVQDFSTVRILTDQDWNEFKNLFEEVHEGLLHKLLKSHQNLTDGEQRLFLLMKLGLSTKEIANILGVSPDSVKKGRYRLKKKMGLADTTPLQDFVTSFGT